MSSIGKIITKSCHGLPLAIVVIAGLLKNSINIDWWAQIEKSVASSYMANDENQYMDTLALSYDHLPQHLRPCFLYFGAFPKGQEISAGKLIWLWIAEEYINQDGTKMFLEDIAEDYLMDLISRSLIIGTKGSNGSIKTCRIHDLLHDLCLKKAEEEKFSPNLYKGDKHSYSCPHYLANPSTNSQFLLSITVLSALPLKCSCYSSEVSRTTFKDISVVWDTSKIITALDLSSLELFAFPIELLQLVHLRYLDLWFRSGDPPESISDLRELQTLIMSSRMNMVVPKNMWTMINLKHLCIKSGENLLNFSNAEEEPHLLENLQLQTMSLVSPSRPCLHILAKTSNLCKLGLCGPLTTKSGELKCPDLGQLMHLESLKLFNTISLSKTARLSDSIIFPESLRSLTFSNTFLEGSSQVEISCICW